MNCDLRKGEKQDLPFIYNSWLKSFSENNKDYRRMGDGIYFKNFKRVLERLLTESEIVIACNPEEHSQIYGYAVADSECGLLHYIYVKYPFRRMGVARKLLKNVHVMLGEDPLVCTFANKNFDILKDKYLLTYNPFLR